MSSLISIDLIRGIRRFSLSKRFSFSQRNIKICPGSGYIRILPYWFFSNLYPQLQSSISKALVHFYPLAGRIRWLAGARFELDCNGNGAQLIQAESDATLDDLGDFVPSPDFLHLIPQINYYSPIEEIPLVIMQLTKFRCGSVTLGYSISHAVVNGQSALHFISEWVNLARGEPLALAPFLDRRLLRAGEGTAAAPRFEHLQFDSPALLLGRSSSLEERERETIVAKLKMTNMEVERLKNEANKARFSKDAARPYTRYESISAHIWRCACRVRGHVPDQPTAVGICVYVRGRMDPPLPENAIVDVIARGRSGELTARPLGYAASRIREAIEGVTSEYVHSAVDYLMGLESFAALQDIHALRTKERSFYGNPNISVIGWTALPLHGVDFGWGKEIFLAPGTLDGDGDSLIMPDCEGGDGGLVVALCLQAERMDDFKKFFYQGI